MVIRLWPCMIMSTPPPPLPFHLPHTLSPASMPAFQVGNLVFLSARPHLYKDMSEAKSYAKFKKLQVGSIFVFL